MVWPTGPALTTNAVATPATFGDVNTLGREMTLSPGNYGVLSPVGDQEIILQAGAIVEQINYVGVGQLKIRGENPRDGIIRSILGSPDSADVLFDEVHFEHTPSMTGATSIRKAGARIAIVNSSALVGGYVPSAFGTQEAALQDSIVAGCYFISDGTVQKTGEGTQSLSRMQEVHRQVWVGNYQVNLTGQAGARWHANDFGNVDLFIAGNLIHSSHPSAGTALVLNPGAGGGTPVGSDRVQIIRNKIYQSSGAQAFDHDAHATIRATNVELIENEAYAANAGFPLSEVTWLISDNTEQPYEAPPTAESFLGW